MLHVGPHIIFGDSDELAIRAVPDISKDFDSILFLWDFCDLIKGKFISKGYWNLDIKVRCNSPSIHQFYIFLEGHPSYRGVAVDRGHLEHFVWGSRGWHFY